MTKPVAAPALPLLHTWRLATAVRVFALALALGQAIAGSMATVDWVVLGGLTVVAALCCVVERPPAEPRTLVPVLEVVAAAVLVVLAPAPVAPFSAYLAAPGLAAGLRLGARATGHVAAACGAVLAVLGAAAPVLGTRALEGVEAMPWLLAGLGSGLLAAAQTRAARRAATEQAPYAAAHHLLGQLHALVKRRSLDLDLQPLCDALHERAGELVSATRSSIWVRREHGDVELLSSVGGTDAGDARAARSWLDGTSHGAVEPVALPLRVGEEVFGLVLVHRGEGRSVAPMTAEVQRGLDELAVRLDTALLVERLRDLATSEERRRLARDLHDGVAQRLAALGFVVDDLAAAISADDPDVEELADDLREEVTGIVQDLRFSVNDLRQDGDAPAGLGRALTAAVEDLRRRSGLRVHLAVDTSEPDLPTRVEVELLRIAQEALTNAERHASAANVWVRATARGAGDVLLEIQDDGVGRAAPRPGHFGLHTMRERAERIGAAFVVGARCGGGTTVSVRRASTGPAAAPVQRELVGSIPT